MSGGGAGWGQGSVGGKGHSLQGVGRPSRDADISSTTATHLEPAMVSGGSAGQYQADEQVGIARLRWRVPGR